MKKIVIIGGGFAGAYAARALELKLRRRKPPTRSTSATIIERIDRI